ncbi:unnamed protein product, partial [Ixodes hexagonus]
MATPVSHTPPPKSGAFDIVVPLGTSSDDLIDAVACVVGLPEVYSAQHLGAQSFQIVVNSRSAAAKLKEAGAVTIASTQVPIVGIRTFRPPIVPAGPQVTNVTCMFLPTFVRNELLVQALSAHGKVLEITHAMYHRTPTVKTGTRHIKMEMKESDPVPNFLRVGGHRATFDYRGIKRVCRRCRGEVHIRANCTTEYCDRCAVFGHATEGCTVSCRRCGGSHATVDCAVRRSYSSMVSGTASSEFPPLPPPGNTTRAPPPTPDAEPEAPSPAPLHEDAGPTVPGNAPSSGPSGSQPLPADLPGSATAIPPTTSPVTPKIGRTLTVEGHEYTTWSEAMDELASSSDSERLVIAEDISPDVKGLSEFPAGTSSATETSTTMDTTDSTTSSQEKAQETKRAITSSGSCSPRSRDAASRRSKKLRPGS